MRKFVGSMALCLLMMLICTCVSAEDVKRQGTPHGASKAEAPQVFEGIPYESGGGEFNVVGGFFKFVPNETGAYAITMQHAYSVVPPLPAGKTIWPTITVYYEDGTRYGTTWQNQQAGNVAISQTWGMEEGKVYYIRLRSDIEHSNWYGNSVGPHGEFYFSICGPNTHIESSETVVSRKPTCTEAGEEERHCALCNKLLETVSIPALGHTPGQWQVESKPSCSEPGWNVKRCTVCMTVAEREEVAMLPHTPGEMVVIEEPLCDKAGHSASHCTVCGTVVSTSAAAPTGHVKGEWQVTLPATCETNGRNTLSCTVCGAELASEELPATGHAPGPWRDSVHASCTAEGQRIQYCSLCDEALERETIPAHGHQIGDWQVTREASCGWAGQKVKRCAACGETLETMKLDALAHRYGEWEITLAPTRDSEGEQRRMCLNCGHYEYQELPKVEKFLGIF